MDTSFYRKPVPAVCIAIGVGIVAGKANANAAKALGMPLAVFSGMLALLLMVLALGS
jgi:hypothetical protein